MRGILLITILCYSLFKSQIGVNTAGAKALLEVKELRVNNVNEISSMDGIMVPKLTLTELVNKSLSAYEARTNPYTVGQDNQEGTLIYIVDGDDLINRPNNGTFLPYTNLITKEGYYFLSKDRIWKPLLPQNQIKYWDTNPLNQEIHLASNSTEQNIGNSNILNIKDDGSLGLSTSTVTKKLDIDANNDYIRIRNLAEQNSNAASRTMVIDDEGYIYSKDVENFKNQIIRIPLSDISNSIFNETGLRFSKDTLSLSPNGQRNYLNTIVGAKPLLYDQTLTAGTGLPARTTDRIPLKKGIYKISVRLVGNFTKIVDPRATTFVKIGVNNREMSMQNFFSNSSVTNYTSYTYTDFLDLNTDSLIDFTVDTLPQDLNNDNSTQNFLISPARIYEQDNTRQSVRSLIMIQRLR